MPPRQTTANCASSHADAQEKARAKEPVPELGKARAKKNVPELALVRARAVWLEVVDGVRGSAAALMERLDALTDPERVEDAAMLAGWRAKYENEITERMKSRWWRRMTVVRCRA